MKDGKHQIDFLGKAPIAITFSLVFVVLALYQWFSKGEEKFGTDYRGGAEIVVAVDSDSAAVRKSLTDAQVKDPVVQAFHTGGNNEFLIRIDETNNPKQVVLDALSKSFGGDKVTIVKSDIVGPTIGAELREKALIATIISLLIIVIYVSVRFEFAFALGALVALIHDVIVATGIYLLAGHTINASTLAGALTIIGYSVNDTIIIFDRVREELFKRYDADLKVIVNEAINAMLGRTIITSVLTLFSAIALYALGGGALADLSFYLIFGIIAGGYSTIYIASPVTMAVVNYRRARIESRLASQQR